ncbi:TPA: hypothetical protein QDC55_000372 [Burkholderia cenocepacia]|uniref:T6SS immunity protein Tli3 family protein n=1 Tax=Burkholderia cenocepacia TaxID=95486 RepID=UPI001BA170C0|nr:hypothetical protein [Burkholderia cenocepacia]MBR7985279.1 hypothetical protein [Burkholderia cenocepacia]HDR9802816.1 hypothetical protein [Burkholderia cenocepacia]HDR9809737.1 hypothetical protein [Burkholderia cenocepacia]HDR9816079.1 hypothetical protein [Burkholderia cenocepacia]HDR9826869.1 hypothetical protein [Burkholderia cenocepacia]
MVRNLVIVTLMLLMQACSAQKPYSFSLADFLSAKELPYDSPPQVIYRLDDHRFVTLERYRDCYHGETFYNDTKANIRKKIGIGLFEDFQGRIVNADPTGMNIVLPLALPPRISCGDRGCAVPLWYSTDGGATFHLLTYMPHSFKPFEDSKDYTVAVTSDKLFIAKKFQYRSDRPEYDLSVRQYTLAPSVDRNKPYQPIVESDGAWASKKKLMPDGLRTPSGQDRITCDASIKPTNPNAPLVR